MFKLFLLTFKKIFLLNVCVPVCVLRPGQQSGLVLKIISKNKELNDHLFGKELFIWFTVRVFRERLSICVCASFPSDLWDLIVSVPDRGLSLYLVVMRMKLSNSK